VAAAQTFEGRETIRICVTHGETGPGDIDELVNTLCQWSARALVASI